ncbi:MAG: hypothetical protein COC22_03795 [Flavobacteriaceae bacterium]|nr:MAG: hypothetical protein COC22_03795 [Flavobacteriaceae bacterium]
MADAYNNNVVFYPGVDGVVQMDAPDSIWNDPELMQLIRNHKQAIQGQLLSGFDCVRDGLSISEARLLRSAANKKGHVTNFAAYIKGVMPMNELPDLTDKELAALMPDVTDEELAAMPLDTDFESIDLDTDVEGLL